MATLILHALARNIISCGHFMLKIGACLPLPMAAALVTCQRHGRLAQRLAQLVYTKIHTFFLNFPQVARSGLIRKVKQLNLFQGRKWSELTGGNLVQCDQKGVTMENQTMMQNSQKSRLRPSAESGQTLGKRLIAKLPFIPAFQMMGLMRLMVFSPVRQTAR